MIRGAYLETILLADDRRHGDAVVVAVAGDGDVGTTVAAGLPVCLFSLLKFLHFYSLMLWSLVLLVSWRHPEVLATGGEEDCSTVAGVVGTNMV